MSRSRYVYDRHGLLAEYSEDMLVWARDGGFEQDNCSGPQVIKDIEPYKSMIDGQMITSRSRHRDHLRAHGCIEVGNEKMTVTAKPVSKSTRKRVLHEILADKSDRQVQQMVRAEIERRRH